MEYWNDGMMSLQVQVQMAKGFSLYFTLILIRFQWNC